MHRYGTSDIDIPELHIPTKRNEFGSMIRKIWTKISLVKLGGPLSTSNIPFISLNEPSDDAQEIYKSKSESATYSLKFVEAEPLLPNVNTLTSRKDLRAATAAYSLPDINVSELFTPSISSDDLVQSNYLFDSSIPCSSKQIPPNDLENRDEELLKPQQYKCKMQILRLSNISENESASIWRTDATRDIPKTVIEDDLYNQKTKLTEVFGRDVEIPSTGPEAEKIITSKAYVSVLSGHENISCIAYHTTKKPKFSLIPYGIDEAVQVDLDLDVRKDTQGVRITPFGWVYLERVTDIQLVDYRVSN